MFWAGKIIGFLVGYLFFREIGAVFGLLIGHYVDITRVTTHGGVSMNAQQRFYAQQAYFKTTFLVMGHIAKADGRVSEDEIRAARTIMSNMNLSEQQKREAIQLFNEGKQAYFNLQDSLAELHTACGNQPMLYRMFIDIQFRAASADGYIGPFKQKILNHICQQYGFNYHDFAGFYQHTQTSERQYHQSASQQGHQRQRSSQQHAAPPNQRTTELNNAYKILGASKSDTDAVVKKKYRIKMSENHPDKLISKGLPEEMIKLANQKTSEIKQAYELIKKRRAN